MSKNIKIAVCLVAAVFVIAIFLWKQNLNRSFQSLQETTNNLSDSLDNKKKDLQQHRYKIGQINTKIQSLKNQNKILETSIAGIKQFSVSQEKLVKNDEVDVPIEKNKTEIKNDAELEKNKQVQPLVKEVIDLETTKKDSPDFFKINGLIYTGEKTYNCAGISNNMHEYKHEQTGLEFVLIFPKIFKMGSKSKNSLLSTLPIHKVKLSPFLISKYEISVGIWNSVMTNKLKKDSRNIPVTNISWKSAQKFCNKTQLSLPTEAQWEYSYYGGVKKSIYFWGNKDNKKYSWTKSQKVQKISEVDKNTKPNAFGLYHMSGNVMEWCRDSYRKYTKKMKKNPLAEKGFHKIMRGGSYNFGTFFGTSRSKRSQNKGDTFIGFRCAVNLTKEEYGKMLSASSTGDSLSQLRELEEANERLADKLNIKEKPKKNIGSPEESLRIFGKFINNDELNLENRRIPPNGAKHLQNLHNIREINLKNTNLRGEHLYYISQLKNLKRLNISKNRIDDRDLKHLSGLTELKKLNLANTGIDGSGFFHLSRLVKLEEFDIGKNPSLNVKTLRMLEHFVNLRDLDVQGCKLYKKKPRFPFMPKLRKLDLENNGIRGKMLHVIADFAPNVEFLDISDNPIDNRPLDHLLRLRKLEILNLSDTNIDDYAFEILEEMNDLKHLDLSKTNISEEAIEDLREELWKCKIKD